jgi:sec-independent protein translocase protein TatA
MNGAMMGLDNPIHLLLVLVVLLLVFGAKRLPEMGRSLGHGLRGFKEAISGESLVQHLDAAPAAPVAAMSDATRTEAPVTAVSDTTEQPPA